MNEKLLNLSEKQCPVDELLKYVRAHKCQDCGKCVFGYEGATQLELTLNDITVIPFHRYGTDDQGLPLYGDPVHL